VILFGDSHAADLWPGLRDNSERLSLRQVTATYCPTLLPSYATGSPFCSDVADRFFKQYLRTAHPRDTIKQQWSSQGRVDPGNPADPLPINAAMAIAPLPWRPG
jgi:hypothetical protein